MIALGNLNVTSTPSHKHKKGNQHYIMTSLLGLFLELSFQTKSALDPVLDDLAKLIDKSFVIEFNNSQPRQNSDFDELTTTQGNSTNQHVSGFDVMISNSAADVLNERIDETETSIDHSSPFKDEGTTAEKDSKYLLKTAGNFAQIAFKI